MSHSHDLMSSLGLVISSWMSRSASCLHIHSRCSCLNPHLLVRLICLFLIHLPKAFGGLTTRGARGFNRVAWEGIITSSPPYKPVNQFRAILKGTMITMSQVFYWIDCALLYFVVDCMLSAEKFASSSRRVGWLISASPHHVVAKTIIQHLYRRRYIASSINYRAARNSWEVWGKSRPWLIEVVFLG